jgi:hypothetical protein
MNTKYSKRLLRRERARTKNMNKTIFILHAGDNITLHSSFAGARQKAIADTELMWRLNHENDNGECSEPPPQDHKMLWRYCCDMGFYVQIKEGVLDNDEGEDDWPWPMFGTMKLRGNRGGDTREGEIVGSIPTAATKNGGHYSHACEVRSPWLVECYEPSFFEPLGPVSSSVRADMIFGK